MSEVTKASEWRKPKLKIKTEEYGILELRRLVSEDFLYLQQLDELKLSHREFTAFVIQNQLRLPLIVAPLSLWGDEILIKVALAWSKENDWELQSNIPIYSAFYEKYQELKQIHLQMLRDMAITFSETITRINLKPLNITLPTTFYETLDRTASLIRESVKKFIENIQINTAIISQTLNQQISDIKLTTKTLSIFETIPKYSDVQSKLQEVERTLDESGYGFSLHTWRIGDISKIIPVANTSPKVRNAVLTNKLLKITQSPKLYNEMENLFQDSKLLKGRWIIVNSALKAHYQREYTLSIPVILTQIEGILGDLLILKELVIIENSKLYAIDQNGQKIPNRKNKVIPLNGLKGLVQTSDLKDDDDLKKLIDYLVSQLIPERNNILHGRNISYNKAKLSVQTLLTLLILATEVATLEISNQIN